MRNVWSYGVPREFWREGGVQNAAQVCVVVRSCLGLQPLFYQVLMPESCKPIKEGMTFSQVPFGAQKERYIPVTVTCFGTFLKGRNKWALVLPHFLL